MHRRWFRLERRSLFHDPRTARPPNADFRRQAVHVAKRLKPDSADRFAIQVNRELKNGLLLSAAVGNPAFGVLSCIRMRKQVPQIEPDGSIVGVTCESVDIKIAPSAETYFLAVSHVLQIEPNDGGKESRIAPEAEQNIWAAASYSVRNSVTLLG